jgi:sugar phosphate isomerase/epimerase
MGFDGTSFVFPAPDSPREAEAAAQRFLDGVGEALDRAEELGVRLLIENNVSTHELAGKLLLMTADEFVALFEAFAGRSLGLLLDTGHLNVTARTYGFDPVSFLDTVAPHVEAFHLHDNDGRGDQHRPAANGSWALDAVTRPEFADATVSVEASFPTVADLAAYVRGLEELVAT